MPRRKETKNTSETTDIEKGEQRVRYGESFMKAHPLVTFPSFESEANNLDIQHVITELISRVGGVQPTSIRFETLVDPYLMETAGSSPQSLTEQEWQSYVLGLPDHTLLAMLPGLMEGVSDPDPAVLLQIWENIQAELTSSTP